MLEKEITRLESFVFQCGDFNDIQAWQTLKTAVLAQQTTNKQSTPNYACPKCGAWLSTNEYRTGECHSCCSAISA